jgi:hypothetical protein
MSGLRGMERYGQGNTPKFLWVQALDLVVFQTARVPAMAPRLHRQSLKACLFSKWSALVFGADRVRGKGD